MESWRCVPENRQGAEVGLRGLSVSMGAGGRGECAYLRRPLCTLIYAGYAVAGDVFV